MWPSKPCENHKYRIQPNHNSPDYIELMTTDNRRAQWDALPGPILVIGDTGFIGQTLVSYLLKEKYSIIGASRSDLSISAYARVKLDIRDPIQTRSVLRSIRPKLTINLVGERSRTGRISEYRNSIEINVCGSLNLAEVIIDEKLDCRLMNIGTCEIFGNSESPFSESSRHSPITGYSFSKSVTDKLFKLLGDSYDLDFIILNPSVAYGPGLSTNMFISDLVKSITLGRKFKMSPGEQIRDLIFIDDLVAAILKCIKLWPSRLSLNIGSGQAISMNALADLICSKMDAERSLVIDTVCSPYRRNEIMDYRLDITLAKRILEWCPMTSIDEGLNKTIRSLNQNEYEN